MPGVEESAYSASQALLSAALGGLLCVAASSCGSSTSPSSTSSASVSGSSAAASSGGGAGSTVSTVSTDPDTPSPSTACDSGVSPDPQVTSSTVVANLTLDQFTSECNAESGIVEIQPHCGGSNACRGMSYDTELQTLVVHTCRGMNSCAGFSCVVCD